MKQQLHFVTVAATDLDATRHFYGALGWTPLLDVEGEIIFYQSAPGQVLGFSSRTNSTRTSPHPATMRRSLESRWRTT
ncbi:Putative glyoxalase/bleomycin resistance protein [Mycobacteroides abscessus subsp. abscessus]|nr:Putative glyoxalase/bleomycin resistance protein [Mycobacteroides abscessus subsp. abscessus]SIC76121.1 Putative glyoxalase/bleomycin resistance protein [Mycobacteroides abscessus subsp. abscessus]SID46284.1 Putative glyoxalase/bleomycin resistance protein [Mycobacteroides abscessus subsp. abscessus]SKI76416.1 Putative glyoxalase/bleomycin resistance protein [Mycobacteroides abscessus subsp. abscessus]SKM12522.1 Putative glyoxalase/bleomycin resistance protein [Mycobacteroides abscessus subs